MKKGAVLLLLLLALLFTAGLLHLFNLRFESGDVYPPYSSLRADPLGAKALHDSLADLVLVDRNFSPLSRLTDGRNTTLLYLGAASTDVRFTTNQYRVFESFLRTGGRLILAFHPEYFGPRPNRFTPGGPGPARPPPVVSTNQPPLPRPRRPDGGREDDPTVSIRERWKLDFAHAPLTRDESKGAYRPAPAGRRTNLPLPDELPVHTALHFDRLGPDWQVIYSRQEGTNDYPVLIERPLGGGSLVLVADAYPFSNEALRRERQTRLLAWFIGGRTQVIFDETHLGTRGDPGIAAMAHRYRLHGLAAALVLLAGLFIWHSSASFMPPPGDELSAEATHQVAGKDSAEGFIHLLRRNIAPVDLLSICLEQWKQSSGGGRKPAPEKLEAMQTLVEEQNALEPRQRQPVQTYRQFCEILSKRT